jgi:hypothetical protein
MTNTPPPLAYAASAPLDAPGDPCRIEKSAAGLFITIPPPKQWVLMAGPIVGLVLSLAPLSFVGYFTLVLVFRRGPSEIFSCVWVGDTILLFIAGYNVKRLLSAARFGRKSITISITSDAVTIERGTEGAAPETLPMYLGVSVHVKESAPTMTLGKLLDIQFIGIERTVTVHCYTRQWKLADQLRALIVQQLREFRQRK